MYVFIIVLVLCFIYPVILYNKLVTLRQRVREAWSTVETQLNRRYDLIPNLIEVVKGYAAHEKTTLEAVITARNIAVSANGSRKEKEKAENVLTGTLKTLFAVSEGYPDLKSNENFLELQRELADTENKIQACRLFYNTTVLSLNTKVETFPSNIIAGAFHIQAEQFFKMTEAERKQASVAPKVKF
ncbi:MAG: LemA family protein [Alphaproteobacteria bacterium]|nr:LemA family protein [Alphaproteobacteria bacterium]